MGRFTVASPTASPSPNGLSNDIPAERSFAERVRLVAMAADLGTADSRGALKRRLDHLIQAVFPACRVDVGIRKRPSTRASEPGALLRIPLERSPAGRALVLSRLDGPPFTDDDRAVAEVLAALVATALSRITLAEEHRQAERARARSEARFRQLFEQFPLSVQRFRADGRTLDVNQAWRTLFGLDLEDLGDFNPLVDQQLEAIRSLLEQGFQGETLTIPAHPFSTAPFAGGEGRPLWLEVTVCPIQDPDGGIREALLIHRDVTDERDAAAALQDRERDLREAQRIAQLGNWRWSLAGDQVAWSDELYRIYGRDPQQFETSFEAYLGCVHPDDRAHIQEAIMHAVETGEPFDFEERIFRPDGSVRVLHSMGEALRDADHQIIGLVGACHDVTPLKAAEDAMRLSEESYRTIFELASDAIYVHDIETGDVLDANRQACALHGRSLDDLKRLGIGGLSPGRAPYDDAHARAYVRRAAAGEPQRFEWIASHASGTETWVEVDLSRVHILGEDRVLASVRSIDERKKAEAALQRAYDELEQRVEERTAELAQAEQRFRAIVEASPMPLLLSRATDGVVLYANDRLEALLDAEPGSLVGRQTPE